MPFTQQQIEGLTRLVEDIRKLDAVIHGDDTDDLIHIVIGEGNTVALCGKVTTRDVYGTPPEDLRVVCLDLGGERRL